MLVDQHNTQVELLQENTRVLEFTAARSLEKITSDCSGKRAIAHCTLTHIFSIF